MANKLTALTLLILSLVSVAAQAQTCTDSANSYLARGDAFFGKGEYGRALNDYELALAFDRQSAEIWNKRALAREQCGNLSGALDDFNQALALVPGSAAYLNNRARIFLQQGEIAKALADLNLAIKRAPKFADAYAHRGLAYAAQDEVTYALADFDRALEYNPKLVKTRFNRGLVLLRMGRKQEAEYAFAQFRRMGGQFTAAQQELFKQLADEKP
jgi:tetratricopeptide (TPR) repeat protein